MNAAQLQRWIVTAATLMLVSPPATALSLAATERAVPERRAPLAPLPWLHRPNEFDLSNYYPERAIRVGKSGDVTMTCTIEADGHVGGCQIAAEQPRDYDFGTAALRLAHLLKM